MLAIFYYPQTQPVISLFSFSNMVGKNETQILDSLEEKKVKNLDGMNLSDIGKTSGNLLITQTF